MPAPGAADSIVFGLSPDSYVPTIRRRRESHGSDGSVGRSDAPATRDEHRTEVASLRQATVTLAQAVDTAEKGLNGRAMSAELEQANGTVTYEITVIPIDGKKATVNPKTRQLGG
jgi:uncharacterized membrane protein YkoI